MARLESQSHLLANPWRRLAGPRPGVLLVATVFVFGLVAACAYEFVHSEAGSRRDAERSFAVQAKITAELTASLFGSSAASSRSQAALQFGGEPTAADLGQAAKRGNLGFVLLLDDQGRLLAASPGTPEIVRSRAVRRPDDVERALSGSPWLSDLIGVGSSGRQLIEFALPFETHSGRRVVLEGFDVKLLRGFLQAYLRTPGENKTRRGYLIDTNDRVIAASEGASELATPLVHVLAGGRSAGRYQHGGERYAVSSGVAGSDWRVVLTEPTSVLYPALAGTHSWVLSAALTAFGAIALLMLALLRRMLSDTARIKLANTRLGELNATLEEKVAERTAVAEQRARELARSNSELEQFASVASHDLQEPLRKIRMYCGRLPKRLGDRLPEEAASDLTRIQSAAERMQRLIDDLLSFARVSSRQREFEPVDLEALVRDVASDLEARIEELNARIEVGPLPVVLADGVQIGQVLQNLISNALKFHRDGVQPIVLVRGEQVDGRCVITIADNGIGFEPKYGERIFAAFERLHGRSDYDGTGIGLSIARKIAWRHGGELTATAVPGGGATFTLTLPAGDPQLQKEAA